MSGIFPSSIGGQEKGHAGPWRRGMAQESTRACHMRNGTGKDTVDVGGRQLTTGIGD